MGYNFILKFISSKIIMADNDGVTQLLKAEAEANKIIQQAHEERLLYYCVKTKY